MLLLRSVVTGFGISLGAALFKKHVAPRLGLDDEKEKGKDKKPEAVAREAAADELDG
jgi:hypothetical protein